MEGEEKVIQTRARSWRAGNLRSESYEQKGCVMTKDGKKEDIHYGWGQKL